MEQSDKVLVEITRHNFSAFMSCLAMGTLYAVQNGTLPAEAGIWSLGRRIWKPLAEHSLVSTDMVEALQQCDELSAIKSLLPDKFEAIISGLIEQFQSELSRVDDPMWMIDLVLYDE